jgi:hypothetical protein
MNKLTKIMAVVIVCLLLFIMFLFKYISDIKKEHIEFLEDSAEIARIEEKLGTYEKEKVIRDFFREDGIYYFEMDEDTKLDINSDIFDKVESTTFEGTEITGNIVQFKRGDKVKFEYRYNFIPVPKLAILIDDVGMNTSIAEKFVDLGMRLSYAVLPYLPKSMEAGEILRNAGYTTILHMPMEGSNENLNKNTKGLLYKKFGLNKIHENFDLAYDNVGLVKGFNNHMGSAFTSDKEKMVILLSHAKEKGLFYIDSNTSRKSKGFETAKELGVPTAKCNHFIDNSKKVSDIEKEIERAVEMAKTNKKTLVIGHYHNNVVEALKNKKEFIERNGIKLVGIEQLLE